jgi:hypothetical protein
MVSVSVSMSVCGLGVDVGVYLCMCACQGACSWCARVCLRVCLRVCVRVCLRVCVRVCGVLCVVRETPPRVRVVVGPCVRLMPACPCACRSGWTALLFALANPSVLVRESVVCSHAWRWVHAVCPDVRVQSDGSATHSTLTIVVTSSQSYCALRRPAVSSICPLSWSPPCCSIARVACLVSQCSHGADPALLSWYGIGWRTSSHCRAQVCA